MNPWLEYSKNIKEYNNVIPKDSVQVHVTHCCAKHGCKYGHDNCPVTQGTHKQQYLCESCDHDNINTVRQPTDEEFKKAIPI